MILKTIAVFCALAVVGVVLISCEGDAGPAGPAGPRGPAGPSQIVAYGTVASDGTVLASGPSTVTVTAVRSNTGRYEVTIAEADSVPPVLPQMVATAFAGNSLSNNAVTDADCYGGVSVGASCAFNETKFEVFTNNASGTQVDEQFDFVVLRPES